MIVPTSPVIEPAPACVTTTVPPVPAVKVPNCSAAPVPCVTLSTLTMLALAVPEAVPTLPVAACAELAPASASREEMTSFFMALTLGFQFRRRPLHDRFGAVYG